jgi:NAD(P)-dependent dehydrogenase (short-subunit alcohol dehydrogenase family)
MPPADYLESLFSLRGKIAVVIGGTGELCGAIAGGLAAAGAEVVIVGRNEDKARARIATIEAAGGRTWFHAAEATSRTAVAGVLAAVLQRSGRVDIVVNGAGVNSAMPFFDITEEEFDRIVDVNLKGVFFGCQVFGRHLVDAGEGGSIINLGSMSGVVPLSRVFTYSATKSAVHNLSLNLARSGRPTACASTCSCPVSFPPSRTGKSSNPNASPASWGTRR